MSSFEPVIGLEIHAQLLTRTKMFCACPVKFGVEPNTRVCPVCLGLPGALPTVNEKAVEYAVKMGLAVHSKIAPRSVFARKNYFYPDCPKNYQITQYEAPLCTGGYVRMGAAGRPIRIKRMHLEEDAGRLLHAENRDTSYVDMNRAGVPLIEIVTEPDIRSPSEASLFVEKLRSILQYLDICDGNMEEGSLRCDANVSLRATGSEELGVSTEIKNLNSFKFVEHALESEITRQRQALERGETIEHATLLWDDETGRCRVMRSKEEAHDYRYFPEPDLPPLEVSGALIDRLRLELPELPGARVERFVSEYAIPPYDAGVLTGSKALADYFEATAKATGDAKTSGHWIMGEVLHELNERKITISELKVLPDELARLISHVGSGRINLPTAKDVFKRMAETGVDAEAIIRERGLEQITDDETLERVIGEILGAHEKEVVGYLRGKEKLFVYFVGEVMRATGGTADPVKTTDLLKKSLDARRRGRESS